MHNGVRVLDIHGHVSVPPAANSVVVTMMGSNTPLEANFLSRGTVAGAGPDDLRRTAQAHVNYLDERSIDVQLIGPRPYLMSGWLPDHLAPSWTRYVNDLIHTQCDLFPDRFRGACQLPQRGSAPDIGHCLEELNRCVSEYGFIATYVSPDPQGDRSSPGMSEPYWYPLYERCSELGLPVIVHGTTSKDPRFAVVPNNYQLGFLVEQYLAGQFLAHSDVFERFPTLRVVLCHCGGALNRFIPTDPHISQHDLSANLFYDTCVYDLNVLQAGIKQRGVSQLLFGTEAPGSGRTIRPETGRTSDDLVPVLAEFDFLSAEDRRTIFWSNFERVIPRDDGIGCLEQPTTLTIATRNDKGTGHEGMLEHSLLALPTTCLSDALDRLCLSGQVASVRCLSGSGFAGRAFTVQYGPVGSDGGTVGDYIEDVEPGAVVVLDNGGRDDCTVWGGLLSEVASMNGVAGTLVHGLCRDVERARELDYSVYARGAWMRTGKDRVRVNSVGQPVSVGGVRVRPGDYIRADLDGAVVLPIELAPDVITAAEEIHRREDQIAQEIRSGVGLREARERHGYHSLQSRQPGGGQ